MFPLSRHDTLRPGPSVGWSDKGKGRLDEPMLVEDEAVATVLQKLEAAGL